MNLDYACFHYHIMTVISQRSPFLHNPSHLSGPIHKIWTNNDAGKEYDS